LADLVEKRRKVSYIAYMPKRETTKELSMRPAVAAVLGHVDHGKSSLLEAIRDDFVITKKEAGGITQHIGAYEVEFNGQKITFIDTPGHEAFSAMRQRGAGAADIALLVIDAVEGVKEQTKEAIKFIKRAGVPLIAVFNKMDKPGADPEKVKRELSENDVLVESYGGKAPSVKVSAKEKQGIKELLETILLVAEVEELKADTAGPVQGVVIESALDPQKGPTAALLVKKGILRNGQIIATDSAWGRIRNIADFQGKPLEKARPSQPVKVLGLDRPAGVGESFKLYESAEKAKQAVKKGEKERASRQVIELEEGKQILNVILKTDVLGSAEAIENILKNLPQDKVVLRLLKLDVGDISLQDIELAGTGRAAIFGFRVKFLEEVKLFAKSRGVKVKIFEVIYELVQAVRQEMAGALKPEVKRKDLAKFKISHLFKQSKKEQIIGGRVLEGVLTRNVLAEVIRDEEVVGKGRIKGLQQEKKEIGKVEKGKEAGILFEGGVILEEGDILQIYRQEKEKANL